MKKVILSVTNNLETDQRVNKVALSLQKMGYSVHVVGSDNRLCHDYDPGYDTKRLHVRFKKGALFYAEFNLRLFFHLMKQRCDVYVANDTDTLLASYLASLLKKQPLVTDLHELFPELPEVTNRKVVKWVWTKLEDFILPKAAKRYTVCQSIADYYHSRYNIDMKVVRNLPLYAPFDGKQNNLPQFQGKKVILYQGAVNEGRGIEWLMDAMAYIEDAVFVVIGTGDRYDRLRQKACEPPYKGKVFFLGHIPYTELRKYTLSADLGVCLLKQQGLSYYYALPNRVFDYMQCHVPILATAFPEIARVVNKEGTGIAVNTQQPEELAKIVKNMLSQKIDHDNYTRAAGVYNWENEEIVLKEIYSNL